MNTEELKVTSPEEYDAIPIGELVPLPSGMVVRAKRSSMEGMALKGALPMSLMKAGKALDSLSQGKDVSEEDIERGNEATIFFRELTRKNCIEPKIVYENEEVSWLWPNGVKREIQDQDFSALASWVRGEEVDELDSFRNRKERRASAAQSRGKALQSESVVVTAKE